MNSISESQRSLWKSRFSLFVLDGLAGSASVIIWYLIFDIRLGMGGSQEVMPDAYLHAGLISWVLWELVILSGRNRHLQQIPSWNALTQTLLIALSLFAIAWLLLAVLASHIEVLDPSLPAVLLALHLALATYFLILRPRIPCTSTRLFDFTAALVLITCSLAATEGLLRLSGKAILALRLQAEPESDIRLMEQGVYRILCIGDSNTRGIGAPPTKSYPRQLQEMLERTYGAGRFQVVNAGIPGSNSSDGRVEFIRRWEQADYQAVLVWTGINNLWSLKNAPPHLLQQGGATRLERLSRIVAQRLGHVRLFRLMQLTMKNLRGEAGAQMETLQPHVTRTPVAFRSEMQRARRLLATVEQFRTPPERFTPEQLHAFQLLALPHLMSQAPFQPLAPWVSDSDSANWTARDWTLHGWIIRRLPLTLENRLKSLEVFRTAIELDPQEYWAWVGFARAARQIDPNQAAEFLMELEDKMPDDPILAILSDQGRIRTTNLDLLDLLEERLESSPEQTAFLEYYASLLLNLPIIDIRRDWITNQRQQFPDAPWAAFASGRMAHQMGWQEFAAAELSDYLALSQEYPADAWCRLASFLLEKKDFDLAQQILSPTEAWQLNDPRVDTLLMEILYSLNQMERAIEYGARAAVEHPEDPDLHYSLARAYGTRARWNHQAQDVRRALDHLEKALALGYPPKIILSRLYHVYPGDIPYSLLFAYRKRYQVPLVVSEEMESPHSQRTHEALLLYDLDWIRRKIEERGSLMILLNYPPWEAVRAAEHLATPDVPEAHLPTQIRGEFNPAIERFSKTWNIPLVDNARHWQGLLDTAPPEKYFAPDGHPNALGYGEIARLVMQTIVRQDSFDRWIQLHLHTPEDSAVIKSSNP